MPLKIDSSHIMEDMTTPETVQTTTARRIVEGETTDQYNPFGTGLYTGVGVYQHMIPPIPSPPTETSSVQVSAHNHYYKDVSKLKHIDVYRVLELFGVTDPCLAHAAKKLLVAGGRGHKNIERDVQDVIDSCTRWQEMRKEDNA